MSRDDILERIAEERHDELLFHGTCEAFEMPPRPGAYDDVLWTAASPAIAQTYIPTAGIKLIGYAPSGYQLEERVRPGKQDFWYTIVRNMGMEAEDVEYDARGVAVSWRLPAGYPTYTVARKWLENQGYVFDGEVVQVSSRFDGDREIVLPADWRMPGRLLVTLRNDLRLYDHAGDRESDLTDLEYHDLALFRRLEAEGYDGVVINDFLQDERHGNVGHRSYGLFAAAAARVPWIEIPSVNHGWQTSSWSTPDFEAFQASLLSPKLS